MTIGPDEVDSAATAASLLYGLAAESFVAARDGLVKALRAGGRRDLATEVKALRRPSVIAAELNRALRHAPGQREGLIEAATALARGHHQLLAGQAVDLAGLQRSHRAAVAAVASHAAAHQAEVHAALEAASLDESLHAQLRTATFAAEPAPARGFDLLSLAAVPPRPRPAPDADADATPDFSPAHRADRRRLRSVPDPDHRPRHQPDPDHPDHRPDSGAPAVPERQPQSERQPERPAVPEPERQPGPQLEPEPGRGPEREDQLDHRSEASDRSEAVGVGRRERAAAQRRAAQADLVRAERRVAATSAARDKAASRVAELEARLAEARSHHQQTTHRAEAAEAAWSRARDDLDRT